ncbi:MAG TPA: trypsin-like peptidase domain-containing protein [Acidimicrobiia bacterium]|nr:trypsin-like peptidase domain-containing protein [Acidimicrobiia bacterium]
MGDGDKGETPYPDDEDDREDDRDDDGDHDDLPKGAPPDPLDRNWLHPTELSALTAPEPAPAAVHAPASGSRAASLVGMGVAAVIGALVTVAVLAMTGNLGENNAPIATSRVPGAASAMTATDAATQLAASIVTISVRDDKGTRRGSGVCIWQGGGILTSAHVVGDAKSVSIRTADGREYKGNIAGRDRVTDLVLLSIDGNSDVRAATISDRDPTTGEPVWIMGAPPASAEMPWLTSGIVTSDNALIAEDAGPMTSGLLETDAESNDAATGGALVDGEGSVTGVVIGPVDGSRTTFAVPIEAAVEVAQELRDDGKAKHGSLGLEGVDAPLPVVMSVKKSGPAHKAGIKKGDVVRAIDGRPVDAIGAVTAIVRAKDPGETVTISLRRGREHLTVQVPLGSIAG